MVNNSHLVWAKETKFLGVTILSSKSFLCDFHEARSNFYKALNTILGNLGSNPPIEVALKLIQSKCFPILMYGLSAVTINSKELNKLTFAYNSVFYKLFKVKSSDNIKFCQYFNNCWDFSDLCNYYRLCFLQKQYSNCSHILSHSIDNSDYKDFCSLLNKYSVQFSDHKHVIKMKFWKYIDETTFL